MTSTLTTTNLFKDIFHSIDFDKIIDHPNILIAANFWDSERFQAAKVCYKFMRSIDDLIDNHKAEYKVFTHDERAIFENEVSAWIKTAVSGENESKRESDLIETIRLFRIPAWPLEAFAKSMIYDIYNDGFSTLDTFIDYAGGASVAPASIFVHLCGLNKKNDRYISPVFDVKRVATPCAVFSYLVHIIRDFQKDHLNNLNYFPDDIMERNHLNREILLGFAKGNPVSGDFRNMIKELYEFAEIYRQLTYEMIQEINPFLEPRYQLSLEIIFALYQMVFERINLVSGKFTTLELNPSSDEIKDRVWKTINNFEAKC